jgi:acyl-CoA synthetase (AMP-forming)/AMP-acid ligase II
MAGLYRRSDGRCEGYIYIVDRKKDMITGGENVFSTEVENVLYTHPAILKRRWACRCHLG